MLGVFIAWPLLAAAPAAGLDALFARYRLRAPLVAAVRRAR